MRRVGTVVSALALLVATTRDAVSTGQTPTQFEVASIRPNLSGVPQMVIRPRNGRFNASNVTPQFLIRWAYELLDFRVIGLPAWATRDHFDIDATGLADLNEASTRPLVKALLAGRFGLRTHLETRQLPVFALSSEGANFAKAPNLRATQSACSQTPPAYRPPPPRQMFDSSTIVQCGVRVALGHISGAAVSMAELAEAISREVRRPVIDKTQITDRVDVVLNFTPEAIQLAQPDAVEPSAPNAAAPSIFTAVREQLRLRLVGDDAPIDVLVVDQISHPSEN